MRCRDRILVSSLDGLIAARGPLGPIIARIRRAGKDGNSKRRKEGLTLSLLLIINYFYISECLPTANYYTDYGAARTGNIHLT